MPGVENLVPIMKPYKLASKELKQIPSIIDVKGVKIGGENLAVIAGPCAIENEDTFAETAIKVKEQGANSSEAVHSSPGLPHIPSRGLRRMA
jgi:3-deoxy-7-phosphoheptulonate synthase